jgi:hypothetical protein
LIINDYYWFLIGYIYFKCEISHSHVIGEVAHTTKWNSFSKERHLMMAVYGRNM